MREYSMTLKVSESDLDELQHVNNIKYLGWIQDIAKAHWQTVTQDAYANEHVWVVRNHNITYHRAAVLNDVVELKTYIESSIGAISTRIVELKDHKSGHLFVTSKTEWCLLNTHNMKPTRIPDHIKSLFE
ncbi:MAG: acyl-CoA thioesterase [Croceitalea sp.]|nr:acyl-CoA thioesterase [Croceitalea sp.]MBT8237649.1 acyl-CoA thioesterase [Croceitalea sp.]NNL10031.1 acyl-CoA thioesterase [Croceitalea sp.]NNM18091.1 acyl-CoA thioesterase [Croceitalea sp.]